MLVVMKNISRSRILLAGVLALTLSACSKSSDDAAQTTSEIQSETTSETMSTTTLDLMAQENVQQVLASASSFDRQLRTMASFGQEDDLSDTDPRRPILFVDMVVGGCGPEGFSDVPDANTAGTALANDQLRVLMWQGGGQASVKWTRIACPVEALNAPVGGTLLSDVGENSKLYNPATLANICVQFHMSGQSVWMNVSSRANTESVISNVLEIACPSSMFPGITAATGTTYADLSATPGQALVDPTW